MVTDVGYRHVRTSTLAVVGAATRQSLGIFLDMVALGGGFLGGTPVPHLPRYLGFRRLPTHYKHRHCQGFTFGFTATPLALTSE
jgi:hypothetical protein